MIKGDILESEIGKCPFYQNDQPVYDSDPASYPIRLTRFDLFENETDYIEIVLEIDYFDKVRDRVGEKVIVICIPLSLFTEKLDLNSYKEWSNKLKEKKIERSRREAEKGLRKIMSDYPDLLSSILDRD